MRFPTEAEISSYLGPERAIHRIRYSGRVTHKGGRMSDVRDEVHSCGACETIDEAGRRSEGHARNAHRRVPLRGRGGRPLVALAGVDTWSSCCFVAGRRHGPHVVHRHVSDRLGHHGEPGPEGSRTQPMGVPSSTLSFRCDAAQDRATAELAPPAPAIDDAHSSRAICARRLLTH